ncbi:MAG TPA: dihydrodipicolinate synthase family protein, partial [Rhodothermales bacterium]|nr:dihydrodipicolinate synthase family protein [Rhodothermales bacterium]
MPDTITLPDGVYAACLTPLHDDLRIDHETLAGHARWLLTNGCDGLILLGTTGEANSFSIAERMALLEGIIEAGLPPSRLMVGTGCCAVPDTVALTKHAMAHGVGGVLMLPPFYYKQASDDGIFAAFEQVIQQVGEATLQVYLYHFPRM